MSNECNCSCGQAQGACATEYQYAVKVVCGEVKAGENTPVAPGRYWTAVNVHNPDKCKDANFRLKIGIAQLNLQSPVSQYFGPFPLRPDGMVEFDCPIIRSIAGQLVSPPPPFVKGFLVLECDRALDVVAVYSGSAGSTAANTFSTERVPARCVPVCDDLVLPLHTGFADWQTVPPTAGLLGPVQLVQSPLPSGWMNPPPFGSSWVSQLSSDNGAGAPTLRRYELCFELCSGFIPPAAAFPIQVLTDGYPSPVFLNNTQIGTVGAPGWTVPTTINVPSNLFRAGHNCFRVDVTNVATAPNPTGLALAGFLRVARGKCPCVPLPVVMARPGTTGTTATSATLSEQIAAASKTV
jgi:hypothetical protein